MMGKNDRMSGGFSGNAYGPPGESEGSGSSGRIDNEITASEYSSAPASKFMRLSSDKRATYGVPMQVVPLSKVSSSEKKNLMQKLQFELQQVRMLQKKAEFRRKGGITVSASSDILSSSNGKASKSGSGSGKKAKPLGSGSKARSGLTRDMSGRFESVKRGSAPAPAPDTTNVVLMKQCENLLKRLMGHQFGWVFNTPVDVVKLNIPDYFNVIKHPMDFGTIKSKVASGAYGSPLEFLSDVRLTFSNAMTYNPPGNDVYIMADTLSKFFEVRWKNIEKKLAPTGTHSVQPKRGPTDVVDTSKIMPPAKKVKTSSLNLDNVPEPLKRKMTDEEKHNLGLELESLLGEMPPHIIDFLKSHSSNGGESGGDEIEIDIDELDDDTLFRLKELLGDYVLEKKKNQTRGEPCEIELLNESGLSNSSLQQGKGNDPGDEDVDILGNDPPVSSYPLVDIEKETGHESTKAVNSSSSRGSESGSPDSGTNVAKVSHPAETTKGQETVGSGAQVDEKDSVDDPVERNQSLSGLDQQLDHNSQLKPSSVESDSRQDGEITPIERQISPEKLYRAAILKNRFADTILKAREKTLTQGDGGDPEKLRREREELELQIRKEARAAEDARRRAKAEEARLKREHEREAARQALMEVEKTVEINENSRFLEDLEKLRSGLAEQLPSSADETSPDHHSLDPLGSFNFGSTNPLEQFGLYMRDDEEEEEGEPPRDLNPENDVEEEGELPRVLEPENDATEEGEPPRVMEPANDAEEEGGRPIVLEPENHVEEEGELPNVLEPENHVEEEGDPPIVMKPDAEEEGEPQSVLKAENDAEEVGGPLSVLNLENDGEEVGGPPSVMNPENDVEEEVEQPNVLKAENDMEEEGEPLSILKPENEADEEDEPQNVLKPENDMAVESEPPSLLEPENDAEEESEPPSVLEPENDAEEESEPPSVLEPENDVDEEGEPQNVLKPVSDAMDEDEVQIVLKPENGVEEESEPPSVLEPENDAEEEGEQQNVLEPENDAMEEDVVQNVLKPENDVEEVSEPPSVLETENDAEEEGEPQNVLKPENDAMEEDEAQNVLKPENDMEEEREPPSVLEPENDAAEECKLQNVLKPVIEMEEGETPIVLKPENDADEEGEPQNVLKPENDAGEEGKVHNVSKPENGVERASEPPSVLEPENDAEEEGEQQNVLKLDNDVEEEGDRPTVLKPENDVEEEGKAQDVLKPENDVEEESEPPSVLKPENDVKEKGGLEEEADPPNVMKPKNDVEAEGEPQNVLKPENEEEAKRSIVPEPETDIAEEDKLPNVSETLE